MSENLDLNPIKKEILEFLSWLDCPLGRIEDDLRIKMCSFCDKHCNLIMQQNDCRSCWLEVLKAIAKKKQERGKKCGR